MADSSNDDGSINASSHGTTLHLGDETTVKEEKLANKETQTVGRLKIVVLLLLVFSAIGVALAVFYYVRNSELEDFEESFRGDAVKVLSSLGANLDLTMEAMDTFATSILSYARETNQSWPFVTVPDFAIRGAKLLSLSSAFYVNTYPLVTFEQREKWEYYSAMNNEWVDESIEIQENHDGYTGPIIKNYTNWNVIHGNDEYDKEEEMQGVEGTNRTGPYLPIWQSYPIIPYYPVYNWDLIHYNDIEFATRVFETHQPRVDSVYMVAEPDDLELIASNLVDADWAKDFIDPSEDPNEPVSDIYYPLIEDSIDYVDVFQDSEYKPQNETFKGMLAMSVYWRDLFRDILPEGKNDVLVVVENPCNPTFTYQLNGPRVVYLGGFDAHDSEFDHLELAANFNDLRDFAYQHNKYTGLPLDNEYCPFQVRLYPGQAKKDQYTTSDSIIFAISAALIFVFTSVVFIIYDICVERRQRLVMTTATKTSAVVNSLFPENVRERMYNDNEDEMEAGKNNFMAKNGMELPEMTNQSSRPIAELYPEATVFFADIAGFTSWSSTRSPADVFVLLETLYGAFDKIAKTRKVFKIETIGDCYVAVVGLPTPQKHHATIMARFAADCRGKMNEMVTELEVTLGAGTADLSLRIGLNSGPVTAGVLRGQKARFQLFGDTVNTAARMESNGVPNKIHVSEATAMELISLNKQAWLTKREDMITAKGKGQMVTYWVEPQRMAGSAITSETLGASMSFGPDDDDAHKTSNNVACANAFGTSVSSDSDHKTATVVEC